MLDREKGKSAEQQQLWCLETMIISVTDSDNHTGLMRRPVKHQQNCCTGAPRA